MSMITHVLVQGAREDHILELNGWLEENDERRQQLRQIDMSDAGGAKYYVCDVYAAAFNYLPWDFVEKLKDPETWGTWVLLVSVIIDGEDFTGAFTFDKDDDGNHVCVTQQKERI